MFSCYSYHPSLNSFCPSSCFLSSCDLLFLCLLQSFCALSLWHHLLFFFFLPFSVFFLPSTIFFFGLLFFSSSFFSFSFLVSPFILSDSIISSLIFYFSTSFVFPSFIIFSSLISLYFSSFWFSSVLFFNPMIDSHNLLIIQTWSVTAFSTLSLDLVSRLTASFRSSNTSNRLLTASKLQRMVALALLLSRPP